MSAEPKQFSRLTIVGGILLALLVGVYFARPFQLEGKKASDSALMLYGDGQVDLSSHLGKETVVLDFWTTWCVPCRVTLPILDEVAREYADEPVAFYAVNSGESPEAVRQFLEEMPLDVPIVMDTTGHLTATFRAYAYPTTLYIDKQGVIRKVAMGVGPDPAGEMRHEIDALLAE